MAKRRKAMSPRIGPTRAVKLSAVCLFSSWLVAANDDSFCRNAADEHT
jgi:hypothetical protein